MSETDVEMLPEQLAQHLERMRSFWEDFRWRRSVGDPEIAHDEGDKELIAVIRTLAQASDCTDQAEAIIGAYDVIEKWYA